VPEDGYIKEDSMTLVDDESGVRDVGYAILTHLGFNVLIAEDGFKAVQIYEQKHDVIDCVILDLTMPRMDGIEALDELHRIRSDVPVIISSGYNEQAIEETFKERIISGFIQKPYRLTSMGKKIKEVLADIKDQPFPGNACK
jgi:two-component system, cell cycle sensor histidine kinase and response regulator CckA